MPNFREYYYSDVGFIDDMFEIIFINLFRSVLKEEYIDVIKILHIFLVIIVVVLVLLLSGK